MKKEVKKTKTSLGFFPKVIVALLISIAVAAVFWFPLGLIDSRIPMVLLGALPVSTVVLYVAFSLSEQIDELREELLESKKEAAPKEESGNGEKPEE